MILVDEALAARESQGRPIRVGMIGAGFMARAIARQLRTALPGMRLVAIANRTPEKAVATFERAGDGEIRRVADARGLAESVAAGARAVTDDHRLLCSSPDIDVIVEATGAIEHGAHVITAAIEGGKDVVSMNVELDATVGPILQRRALAAGVVVTGCDGDQPAVQCNLVRFVRSLGLTPLVCGNIKGLQDHYRTPETQRGFAAQWGQTPEMVTSFADGTKISMEQALVANALGMSVARAGMLGPNHDGHVDDLREYFLREVGLERLRELGGVVDYVVGAAPSPGVFVLAANDDPEREIYLRYGKLGDGPLYSFYVPYHLTALEAPLSIARVALFRDHVVTAQPEAPRVDVVAHAKRDLRAGETLDGVGGFMTYGACERAEAVRERRSLPIGVAEGGRLLRDVARDAVLSDDDVGLPDDRLVVRLRREQDAAWTPQAAA
ncbi:MAG: Gfo/Idh/MocA family oxidoreductase [Trueperaceae bacterium]|nr:Gfo/Idh/MocA family oxidoreductase [Trueperaceae bacterium]